MRGPSLLLAALVLLASPPARAVLGDVAPRARPDGLVTVGDLVVAAKVLRHDIEPTPLEARLLDVSGSGATDPWLVTPPTFVPRGDGGIASTDLGLLREIVMGRTRLPDTPGLLLRDGDAIAFVGVPYENRILLDTRSFAPVTYEVAGAPSQMAADAATGEISYLPAMGDGTQARFEIRATQDGLTRSAQVAMTIGRLTQWAGGPIGPGGGEIEVTEAASGIQGLAVRVAPDALDETTTFAIATYPGDPVDGDGTNLKGPIAVPADAGSPVAFEVSIPLASVTLPNPADTERLAWEMKTFPVADCDGSAATTEMRSVAPAWTQLPTSLVAGRLTATAFAGCERPALLRLVQGTAPPAGCTAAATGTHARVELRRCPADAAVTAASVAAAFDDAWDACSALGFEMPDGVTVVVKRLPNARDAFVDPLLPGVVSVDDRVGPSLLRVIAAHEMVHVAQARALRMDCLSGALAWRNNAFLMEGSAAWLEQRVLDAAADPDGPDFYTSRLFADLTRRSLDSVGPEAWLFFNWLDTALGVQAQDFFADRDGVPPDYSEPGSGLAAIDAVMQEQGAGSLADAYPGFMHDLNVARSPDRIAEIDELMFPPPGETMLDASATEAAPATLCGIVLPHLSGVSWPLRISSGIPEGGAAVLRIEAPAGVRAELYDTATGRRQRVVPVNQTVSTGSLRGAYALHVFNPSLLPDSPVATVDVSAWTVPEAPWFADTDGDGWPDDAETEAGSDPADGGSQPQTIFVARGSARAFVPATDDPVDTDAPIVVGRGSARVFVPHSDDVVDVDVPVVVGRGSARVFVPWTDDPLDTDVPVIAGRGSARVFVPWTDDPVDTDAPVVVGRGSARVFVPWTDDPADSGAPIYVARPWAWVDWQP